MIKATISPAGEIAIPEGVREQLNLTPGTEVEIDVQGQRLIVKKVAVKKVAGDYGDWRSMEGMAKGGESLTKALEEDRRAEHAHYEARINKGR